MGKDVQYWFSLFAVAQGCTVLGVTIFIFIYYVPKKKNQLKDNLRWHVMCVSCSYILLTFATVNTAAIGVYRFGEMWYWVVISAYVIGDISLIFIFRASVKKHRQEFLKKNN
jgi:tellurite resistance protein TehA-like permease